MDKKSIYNYGSKKQFCLLLKCFSENIFFYLFSSVLFIATTRQVLSYAHIDSQVHFWSKLFFVLFVRLLDFRPISTISISLKSLSIVIEFNESSSRFESISENRSNKIFWIEILVFGNSLKFTSFLAKIKSYFFVIRIRY